MSLIETQQTRPGRWLQRLGSSETLLRLLGASGVCGLLRGCRRARRRLFVSELFVYLPPSFSTTHHAALFRRIERLRRAGWQVQVRPMSPAASIAPCPWRRCQHPCQPAASAHRPRVDAGAAATPASPRPAAPPSQTTPACRLGSSPQILIPHSSFPIPNFP